MYRRPMISIRTLAALMTAVACSCGGCDPESTPGTGNNGGTDSGLAAPDASHDAGSPPDSSIGVDDDAAVLDTGPDAATCEPAAVCGTGCCEAGQDCIDSTCLPACDGTRCGDASDLCCVGAEVCIFDGCHVPGIACQSTFQCPTDEYCEPTLGACLPANVVGTVCEYRPPIGMFEPSPETQFLGVDVDGQQYDKSMATPAVADIDGDGMPEIAAVMYRGSLSSAVLVVVNGEDMSVVATSAADAIQPNTAGIAVANLDPSTPELEIVAQRRGGGLIAFRLDAAAGTLVEMWSNSTDALAAINNESAPSIADLDQDGSPEVILGFSVVDASGNIFNGLNGGPAGGQAANSAITTAVDIDQAVGPNGERALELVAGNRVMNIDGTMLWDRSADFSDGFPAVGDLDGDGSPEVVTVTSGRLVAFAADGQTVFGPIDLPGGGQGGAPTIADFDGDGRREIAAAGRGQYTVFDPDCQGAAPDAMLCPTGRNDGILWSLAVQDLSSSRTGSSVFDFEGDGRAEVVYNDECFLRVLDGLTGDVLFERANTTRTGSEFPIIVDVDGDFNAEIVVVSNNDQIGRDKCEENNLNYPVGGTKGIFVYGDANDTWVPTRRIWNQHAYHITNILDDGSVPSPEPLHYASPVTNSFRLNVQPDGLFNAPDLVVEAVEIRNPSCGEQVTVEIAVTVTNEGAQGVGPGQEVEITADNNGDVRPVATVTTTGRLLPGQSETILVSFTLPAGWTTADFTVNGLIDPNGTVNECDETNNQASGTSAAGNRTFDDVKLTALSVQDTTCAVNGVVRIAVTLENQGAANVPARLPIVLEAVRGTNATLIDTVRTGAALGAGTSESFDITWNAPATLAGATFEVRATVDPNGEVSACSSDTRSTAADCLPPQ